MGADPIDYLRVDTARLLATPQEAFDMDMVSTLLTARGISYDTHDGIVTTVAEEEHDNNTTYTYSIQFQPANNLIIIRSQDTFDVENMVWYLNDLVPDLLGDEEPELELTGTYTLLFAHPTVNFDLLVDAVGDAAERETTDNGEDLLAVNYTPTETDIDDDEATIRIFEDGIIFPSHVDEDLITEFATHCNGELHRILPDAPDEFAIEELPTGWFDPVLAAHPNITDVIDTTTRPDDIQAVADQHDLSTNAIVVMLLDVIGAGLYAIETLDDDGRAAFYNAYSDADNIFHDFLLRDDGDLINRGAFLADSLWSPEAAHRIEADKERYRELQRIAESYADYELEEGDVWRMHSSNAHVWLDVELLDYGQLPDEDFPHTPVWIGNVIDRGDGHNGDIPSEATETVGDTVIVDGRELDERIESA